jgi:hypothetical protein
MTSYLLIRFAKSIRQQCVLTANPKHPLGTINIRAVPTFIIHDNRSGECNLHTNFPLLECCNTSIKLPEKNILLMDEIITTATKMDHHPNFVATNSRVSFAVFVQKKKQIVGSYAHTPGPGQG